MLLLAAEGWSASALRVARERSAKVLFSSTKAASFFLFRVESLLRTGCCGLEAFLSGELGKEEDLLELLSEDSSRCERLALVDVFSEFSFVEGACFLLSYSSGEGRLGLG